MKMMHPGVEAEYFFAFDNAHTVARFFGWYICRSDILLLRRLWVVFVSLLLPKFSVSPFHHCPCKVKENSECAVLKNRFVLVSRC